MRRFAFLAVAVVAAAPLVAVVVAQPRQPGRTAPAHAGYTDAQLAGWLIIDNQEEIALAELAQQKAESEQVKEFAAKMIEEHTQCIQKLEKYSPGISKTMLRIDQKTTTERRDSKSDATRDENRKEKSPKDRDNDSPRGDEKSAKDKAAKDEPAKDEPATEEPAEEKAAEDNPKNANRDPNARETERAAAKVAGRQPGGMLDILSLKQELAQECLQSTSKELSEKEGKEFDQCYMTQQCMAHMKMVTTLKVFRKHASPNLQPILDEGLQTAQEHLQHCKGMVKSLEGDSKTAARPDATKEKE